MINWKYIDIVSSNDLALNMRQAVTLTNNNPVKLVIYVAPGLQFEAEWRIYASVI